MKRIMQDDSVVEKEAEKIVHATNSTTSDELLTSNLEDSTATAREKDYSQQIEIIGSRDRKVTTYRSADELTLPELSRRSFSLVPYVKRSLTLQKLVMLGVDLDKVQRVREIPELLMKSNFNKDIWPLLQFLLHIKIPVDCLGKIFTKNPLLFKESVDNLELRVGYLVHKKFKLDDIAAMAVKCSVFLLMDVHKLDEKLGFLQNTFHLTGEEVRHVALTYPKILPWRHELIADVRFHIKESIGFNDSELKQIMLKEPSLYMNNKSALVRRFDYLHTHMSITHEQVVHWPGVLSSRDFIIKNRHMFLLSLNRAQYDPCLENYVSMKALVTDTDEEFCKNVAKCDVNKFYDFCKTI
ncbi:Transcription termination factor 3, mitochondrial [Bulinus truncatus]|nr:Transcription termination factor 3, mitochondrial [Bulinus truncatus]